MDSVLLFPPVLFLFFVLLTLLQLWAMGWYAAKGKPLKGKGKAYACGEDVGNHRVTPDYSQFFPFAFFFTIMHVVALIIATVPKITINSFALAGFYIVIAVVGLYQYTMKEISEK